MADEITINFNNEESMDKNIAETDTSNQETVVEQHSVEETTITPARECTDYNTIVVCGGSLMGIINLGCIQYAFDNYYLKDLDNYFGTSSGAFICYLLAIGYTPIEIMVYICTKEVIESLHETVDIVGLFRSDSKGLAKFEYIAQILEKMTIEKTGVLLTMGDLKRKFGKSLTICTYNITAGKTVYVSSDSHPDMPCITALRMTSNLPYIFEPFCYRDNFYIDGGVCDNFPIMKAMSDPSNKVIGFDLDYNYAVKDGRDITNMTFLANLFRIPVSSQAEMLHEWYKDKCDIIRVFTEFIGVSNISSTEKLELFSDGYNNCKKYFEEKESCGK